MWEAIRYVSSGLTLIAFLAAIGAYIYRRGLRHRENLIRSVDPADRAALVDKTLEFFRVDTSRLNRDQQYNLALQQIAEDRGASQLQHLLFLELPLFQLL